MTDVDARQSVPVHLDRSLANYDVDDVGSCCKSWSRVRASGESPSGRASHSATALDCFRFVVVGGGACGRDGEWTHFNDAHIFDVRTRAWTELEPVEDKDAGAFLPRRGHAAAIWCDEKVIIFGGTAGGLGEDGLLNDCWCLDTRAPAWRRFKQDGKVPPGRRGALAFYAADHFLLTGGYTAEGAGVDANVYSLNPATSVWSLTSIQGPILPFALAAGARADAKNMFVFGGSPSAGFLWLRVTKGESRNAGTAAAGQVQVKATQCSLVGDVPSPRYCHGMAAIANRWLLVFGGSGDPNSGLDPGPYNDSYLLDLRRCAGDKPLVHSRRIVLSKAHTVPKTRNGFTLVGLGTKFIVFGGGIYRQEYLDDVWVLDLQLRPNVAIPAALPGVDIGADFAWLRQSEEGLALADVSLKVGEGALQATFPAHRAILCSRSDYFRALLARGFREASDCLDRGIVLPDLDPVAFNLVLDYIYTGCLSMQTPEPYQETSSDVLKAVDIELLRAAQAGDIKRVSDALSAGANVDARDSTGMTALHVVSSPSGPSESSAIEIVRLLVPAKCDINASLPSGQTPVQVAAAAGRKLLLREFLVALTSESLRVDNGTNHTEGDPKGEGDDETNTLEDDIDAESVTQILQVLVSADRLGLAHLGLLCERWLACALRPGNACDLIAVADELQCAQLRLVCIHFLKNHSQCRRSSAFQALPSTLQEEVSLASQSL